MKTPFDIKFRPQIKYGEYKVKTESGIPAKIFDWEWNDKYAGVCLAVKITKEGKDIGYLYTEYGKRVSTFPCEKDSDLFIVTPEPELSEFEHAFGLAIVDAPEPEEKEEWYPYIKEKAAELLELAKEEYKEEVLKNLPRWRKWENGACGNGQGIPIAIVKRGLNGYELVDALGIQGEQYIMLSDLEKLAGFKE